MHQQTVSAFVRPTMRFVNRDKCDWAKNKEAVDEYTARTPELMIAHAYALEQRLAAHHKRVKRGESLMPFHYVADFWEAMHKGTRLPRPDPELGHMDRYELSFDSVWETGFWYEQVIKRLGGCSGVLKHFLVLCGLSEQTSLHELAIALYGPYLQSRVPDRAQVQFHRSSEWLQPLMQTRQVFAWGAIPHLHNRKVEGVEVVLGMHLAVYIVAQGLLCRGWKRTSDGYTVITHLSNMAHMSLELAMLFVHTRVEKAAIPANSGALLLPQRSPLGKGPARITFDERLHVDSTDAVHDMLCMRARTAGTWRVLGGDKPFLQLLDVRCEVASAREMFPFPPESVAHMHTHYVMMHNAQRSLYLVDANKTRHAGNLTALAMRLYGIYVTSDMVSYVPVTITHCVTRAGREIPCVTYADGYVFTLRLDGSDM